MKGRALGHFVFTCNVWWKTGDSNPERMVCKTSRFSITHSPPWYPVKELTLRLRFVGAVLNPSANRAKTITVNLPSHYAATTTAMGSKLAMTTGFEPVSPSVTGKCFSH